MKNLFQAVGATHVRFKGHFLGAGRKVADGSYPTVPATWPNRLVRRAVRKANQHLLPNEWREFLRVRPDFTAAIKASNLA